jgi:GNAT superfamily N-acetyltransferase
MEDIFIRVAEKDDIPAMMRIRHAVKENRLSDPGAVTSEDCLDFITRRGKGWVAIVEGKIRGFAITDLLEQNIWALFIHPDSEGMGIGKKLHDTLLGWYFQQGKAKIWLSTDPDTRAERFYRLNGWASKGLMPNGEIRFEMTHDEWQEGLESDANRPV